MFEIILENGVKLKLKKIDGEYYKMVAPDGGWGYVVVVALIVIMGYMQSTFMSSFGIIFNDFINDHNITTTYLGFQSSATIMSVSSAGYLAPVLARKLTFRKVALMGALLLATGSLIGISIDSRFSMLVCYGILQGLGNGLIINMSFTVFNHYFDKKRTFIMSLCQTVVGLIQMIGPPLVAYSMQSFGFRGTLAILGALSLNTCVAVLTFQPVDRHLKPEKLTPAEQKEYGESLHLHEDPTSNYGTLFWTQDSSTQNTSKIMAIMDFFNLSLFKNYSFTNICIGLGAALFSDMTFFMWYPLYLYSKNWSSNSVAALISCVNIGDAVARFGLVIFFKYFKVKSRTMILGAVILDVFIRITVPYLTTFPVMSAFFVIWGIAKGVMVCMLPLVFAETLPLEQYPSAQGLSMMTCGFIGVIAGPIIGAIRDYTKSYVVSFHVLTSMLFIFVILPWSLEALILRRKRRNQQTNIEH